MAPRSAAHRLPPRLRAARAAGRVEPAHGAVEGRPGGARLLREPRAGAAPPQPARADGAAAQPDARERRRRFRIRDHDGGAEPRDAARTQRFPDRRQRGHHELAVPAEGRRVRGERVAAVDSKRQHRRHDAPGQRAAAGRGARERGERGPAARRGRAADEFEALFAARRARRGGAAGLPRGYR